MKAIKTILGALAVASMLGFSFSANAQENGNRDEDGNIVRGPYETNNFGDNWFLGVGGGLNGSYVKGATNLNLMGGPAAEVFVGKWFTPSVGARVGYRGLKNSFDNDAYSSWAYEEEKFNQNLVYADLMWNVSNALSGYKETRFWDVILYGEAGGIFSKQSAKYTDVTNREWVLGAGWLNDFRLGGHVDLYVDLAVDAARSKTDGFNYPELDAVSNWALLPKATVGLIFNLGRANWDRHSSVTPVVVPVPFTTDQYNALKNRVAELEKENAALRDEIEALKNAAPDTVYVGDGSSVIYSAYTFFDLDSPVISAREKWHLDAYYEDILANLDDDQAVVVTGSADAATGSSSRNQWLSEHRANNVKDYLVKKGVPESKISTEYLGGIDGHSEVRRVITRVK